MIVYKQYYEPMSDGLGKVRRLERLKWPLGDLGVFYTIVSRARLN